MEGRGRGCHTSSGFVHRGLRRSYLCRRHCPLSPCGAETNFFRADIQRHSLVQSRAGVGICEYEPELGTELQTVLPHVIRTSDSEAPEAENLRRQAEEAPKILALRQLCSFGGVLGCVVPEAAKSKLLAERWGPWSLNVRLQGFSFRGIGSLGLQSSRFLFSGG